MSASAAPLLVKTSSFSRTGSFHSLPDGSPMVGRTASVYFEGESTLLASSIGLFKNIVGAGLLSLPAGVASISHAPESVVLAVLLAGFMGSLSCYCFWTLGRVCVYTGATTFAQGLARVYGMHWERLVDLLIITKTCSACILYQIIMATTATEVVEQSGIDVGFFGNRAVLLWIITASALLPLSLAKSFAVLSRFAALGALGVLYATAFMCLRWADGSYLPGGRFYADAPFKPAFGDDAPKPFEFFKLASMYGTAFICHFNAPRFAHELQKNTTARLAKLSLFGFGSAFIVMSLAMAFGFLTFGGACQGLILNNYALSDDLVVPARVGILASVIFGFPFLFTAFRDGVLEFVSPASLEQMYEDSHYRAWFRTAVNVLLLAATTAVASHIEDLGFVVALIGSVLASNVVFTLPALAFVGCFKDLAKAAGAPRSLRFEYYANWLLVIFGILLCVQGTAVNLAGKMAL